MTVCVGLTGGIAAGKSTVSSYLARLGAIVIDYDDVARQVVQPGSPALREIVAAFGPDSIDQQTQGLNRRWLADQVFNDDLDSASLRQLEDIEYPHIVARAEALHRQACSLGSPVVVHDIPLLAEVCKYRSLPFDFDHIVVVYAPVSVRLQRLIQTRGMSEQEASARMRRQVSDKERLAIADMVIDATVEQEQMLADAKRLFDQCVSESAHRNA